MTVNGNGFSYCAHRPDAQPYLLLPGVGGQFGGLGQWIGSSLHHYERTGSPTRANHGGQFCYRQLGSDERDSQSERGNHLCLFPVWNHDQLRKHRAIGKRDHDGAEPADHVDRSCAEHNLSLPDRCFQWQRDRLRQRHVLHDDRRDYYGPERSVESDGHRHIRYPDQIVVGGQQQQ